MKLIVTGATGLVGTEVIRQALDNKAITSVVALARKPVPVPTNVAPTADTSKLTSVILEDWSNPYPKDVRDACAGAGALIWLLAVTPSKSHGQAMADLEHICKDFAINCLKEVFESASRPLRVVYMSGALAERDPNKTPIAMPEHAWMRGRCETSVLAFAAEHRPDVEVAIPKPGLITGPGREGMLVEYEKRFTTMGIPLSSVHVSELSVVSIDLVVNGAAKDTLLNDEVVAMSKTIMSETDYVQ